MSVSVYVVRLRDPMGGIRRLVAWVGPLIARRGPVPSLGLAGGLGWRIRLGGRQLGRTRLCVPGAELPIARLVVASVSDKE